MGKVWARSESGHLSAPLHPGTARFVRGRPVTHQDLVFAVQLIYVGDAEFHAATVDGLGVPIGEDLWQAALAGANAASLRAALDAAWVERPGARAVSRLPLATQTRQVLAQPNGAHLTLQDLVTRADVPVGSVERELSGLIALGFYRLRRAANQGTRTPPRRPARTRSPAATPASSAMTRRLEREWQILSNADDWTVLGIPPSSDALTIGRACERMLARYASLPTEGPTGDLARQIQQRIQAAVDNVQAGRASSKQRDRLMADPMAEGQRLAQAGQWNAASRCFALARKQAENARNVAWLGWALYNDTSRTGPRWRERGLELLALAESMGGFATEVQLLRARAELAEADYLRAWNRLERLSTLDPANVTVRSLLDQARSRIKQQGKP